MEVKGVLFDAYGTLCEIRDKRRPFAKLVNASPDRQRARDLVMTRPFNLREAAQEFDVDGLDLDALEDDLAAELASIELFEEVTDVLEHLRASGLRIGVASNLAQPYAEPLLRLLPFDLDAYAWSFSVGSLKPDSAIFTAASKMLGLSPEQIVMVGDTFDADYEGARKSGMHALHLDRAGVSERRVPTIRTLHMLTDHARGNREP
ncbi:HAD family hydrolase [Burkholderia sp. Bp8963]|uniref:HAD family hydrolase n=1 Tax=Burkholderia sp. Bp8963 TaxID=2184547 RepID=UPI000F595533|nr:HAD family hydrolase [Burkholderia sp. Bp8963]RQS59132.1 HAD family hydrolase [Burkholderia sp. Bp8963]